MQVVRARQLFEDSDFAAEDIDENSESKDSKLASIWKLLRVSMTKKVEQLPDFGIDVCES